MGHCCRVKQPTPCKTGGDGAGGGQVKCAKLEPPVALAAEDEFLLQYHISVTYQLHENREASIGKTTETAWGGRISSVPPGS